MSVRASLEANTMTPAGLNRQQALSAGRTSTAKSSADASQGTADPIFRDSLQAHFGSPDSEDGLPPDAASTKAASLSSLLPAEMGAADCVEANGGFASLTADHAGPVESVVNKLDKTSRSQLVAPAAVQKLAASLRGNKPAVASASGSGKHSGPGDWTNKKTNNVGATPDLIALANPAAVVTAPNQNGPIAHASGASSDLPENNSTASASVALNTQASTNASSSPSATYRATTAQETIPIAWPGASSEPHTAVAQADGPTTNQETNGTVSKELETDRSLHDQFRTLASSVREMSPGLRLTESAAQSEASGDRVSAAGSDQAATPEGTPRASDKQFLTNSQLPTTSAAEKQGQITLGSTNENSGLAQSPSDATALESVRYVNRAAESKLSFRAAGSLDVVGSGRTSRLSSSRFASSSSPAQNFKQVSQSQLGAFTPHSSDLSQIPEVTNAGSIPQKMIAAIPSDSRVEDTFAALESGSRNETGAFNWTRTGHMQAEAGYLDPTLGWIGVRAEASGGVVHATLLPQSSDAAQALSGHMAGLHTYLADNRTPVETLTLASFGGNSQQFIGQDSGQGMHQGTGQNAGQGNASEPALQPHSMTRPITSGAVREASISDEVFTRSNAGISSGGVHISVLA